MRRGDERHFKASWNETTYVHAFIDWISIRTRNICEATTSDTRLNPFYHSIFLRPTSRHPQSKQRTNYFTVNRTKDDNCTCGDDWYRLILSTSHYNSHWILEYNREQLIRPRDSLRHVLTITNQPPATYHIPAPPSFLLAPSFQIHEANCENGRCIKLIYAKWTGKDQHSNLVLVNMHKKKRDTT